MQATMSTDLSEKVSAEHKTYVATQIRQAFRMAISYYDTVPDVFMPPNMRTYMQSSGDIYGEDVALMTCFLGVLWVFYLHPLCIGMARHHRDSLVRIARKLHYDAYMKRMRLLRAADGDGGGASALADTASCIGDKMCCVEKFTWAFLVHFDAAPPSPLPNWSSQIAGICLYDTHDDLYQMTRLYGESIYLWPSYEKAKLFEFTRTLYVTLGAADAPLPIADHRRVHAFMMNHLQVVQQPQIKPILDAYLAACEGTGDAEYKAITDQMLYRMHITDGFNDTAIGIDAIRKYAVATGAVVEERRESGTFMTAAESLRRRMQRYR